MLSDDEINQKPVDRFTLLHGLAGVLARQAGISFELTLILSIGWEFLEPKLKETYPDQFPNPSIDSNQNKIVDVLAACAGWIIGGVA